MIALLPLGKRGLCRAVTKGLEVPFLDTSFEAGKEMHMAVAGMVIVLDSGKVDMGVKPLLKGEHCLFGYLPEVEIFAGVLLFSVRAYNDPKKDRALLRF